MKNLKNINICIVGLGYIGLPLSISFAKHFSVIGFDKSKKRINELNKGIDSTKENNLVNFPFKKNILFTYNEKYLNNSNIYILAIPTPVDNNKKPDLSLLKDATSLVGQYLKKGDIVIYESTVYPGVTEKICTPILTKNSGLKYITDFNVGYSPERINPGDKKNTLENITKIISASNSDSLKIIYSLYSKILKKKPYKASSIGVAEAAKVIENTQRDLNIALINELYQIFDRLDIDTYEVIKAAGTKWNFQEYYPGLVGGHCIGVDPYYLTYIAKKNKYNPKVILAGRDINDNMHTYVCSKFISILKKSSLKRNAKLIFYGFTFKENCSDIRNTKIYDLYRKLSKTYPNITIYDPVASKTEVKKEYDIDIITSFPSNKKFDAGILLVSHNDFIELGYRKLTSILKDKKVFFDFKKVFDK